MESTSSARPFQNILGLRRTGKIETNHCSSRVEGASTYVKRGSAKEAACIEPKCECGISCGSEGSVPTALCLMVRAADRIPCSQPLAERRSHHYGNRSARLQRIASNQVRCTWTWSIGLFGYPIRRHQMGSLNFR